MAVGRVRDSSTDTATEGAEPEPSTSKVLMGNENAAGEEALLNSRARPDATPAIAQRLAPMPGTPTPVLRPAFDRPATKARRHL